MADPEIPSPDPGNNPPGLWTEPMTEDEQLSLLGLLEKEVADGNVQPSD